jgi:dehydration protein DpgD
MSRPDRLRVRYEKKDQVAYVVLDRPHVLNATDQRMHEELSLIWDDSFHSRSRWATC